jgi:hypothetical protein
MPVDAISRRKTPCRGALLAPRVARRSSKLDSDSGMCTIYFPVPFPASMHHATNPTLYHDVAKQGLVAPRTLSETLP